MKIEAIKGIRVATPDSGMLLCNEEAKVICDKVYLGINADATEWRDITEGEAQQLEALWGAENSTETPTEEAADADYIDALEELGVDFNG